MTDLYEFEQQGNVVGFWILRLQTNEVVRIRADTNTLTIILPLTLLTSYRVNCSNFARRPWFFIVLNKTTCSNQDLESKIYHEISIDQHQYIYKKEE